MTYSSGDLADALRWFWILVAVAWMAYAWLHRVPMGRVLWGLIGLIALDWVIHWFADFIAGPDSNLPSDFPIYSVWMLLAGIMGLAAACVYARSRGIRVLTVIDAAIVCVIVGGLGGRLYHVLTNWDYYTENQAVITDLTQGGFGLRGAFVLGILALLLFAFITHNSFWKLGDAAALGLALAQTLGWYGAYLTHTQYGISLDAAPITGVFAPLALSVRSFGYNFVQDLPDAYNVVALRVPIQLMASLFFLALFLGLVALAARQGTRPGALLLTYWVAASAAGFVFGFWRGDATLFWNSLRVDQWFDLIMVIIGLGLVALYRTHRFKPTPERILQPA